MFVCRDYKWRDLPRLLHARVKTVAMVMILIGFSAAFGYLIAPMQVSAKMRTFVLGITQNKYVMLLLLNILLLLLRTFMDMAPMILICAPILLPLVLKFGVDPVHFGLILMVNAGIGLITRPVGPSLFVGCAIGEVSIGQVSKELWPFYTARVAALLIVPYVPAATLWLPSFIGP